MPLPKLEHAASEGRVQVEPRSVFLNLPYDTKFHGLFLAYIAGVVSFGLKPRVALEVPGGIGRISRIITLIRACPYSFHDLSRVEVDIKRPHTPRFNMAVELGLAVMLNALDGGQHIWCVFERDFRRVRKSTSDLAGTDVYQHDGTIRGVLREIGNALVHVERRPNFADTLQVYRTLQSSLPAILKRSGANTVYSARVFSELVATATWATERIVR